MSRELARLAERRAQLVADCAQQRDDLAAQLGALRASAGPGAMGGWLASLAPATGVLARLGPVAGWLGRHRKLKLALAGVALGLAATRPRRVLALAAAGFSLWRTVRGALPLLLAR